MKKSMLLVAVVGTFVLASCKKDYVCECKDGADTDSYTFKDVKKKDAKEACDSWGTIYSLFGGSCALK